jgi:hypothetical protein
MIEIKIRQIYRYPVHLHHWCHGAEALGRIGNIAGYLSGFLSNIAYDHAACKDHDAGVTAFAKEFHVLI